MSTVHDVAAYILRKLGRTSTFKLQKLVYYANAWSLVWDGSALFSEPIEAWSEGPVARELWKRHARGFYVDDIRAGDPNLLTAAARDTVDEVVRFYGDRDGDWLSALTHREAPWRIARGSARAGAPSQNVIDNGDVARYFGAVGTTAKHLPDAYAKGLDLLVTMAPDEVDDWFEPADESLSGALDWLERTG